MAEEINEKDTAGEFGEEKQSSLGDAAVTGAVGGAVAGLASHLFADGKMTFPIFIIAYILILSSLKGWGKLLGIIVFTMVAALLIVIFQNLQT